AGGAGGAMTRSARFETRKRVIADRHRRRLDRQLDFIARHLPFLERPMRVVLRPSLWPLRVPLALVLILGGVFSFLPLLGVWMLPLGLLLLAVDVGALRPTVTWAAVRSRRRFSLWRRGRRGDSPEGGEG